MKRGLHQGNEHLRHISRFIFQTLKKGWSEITLSDWWINIEITLDAIAPGYDHKSELKWEESSLLPKAKSDEKKLEVMTSQINNIWLVDQLVKDNCWHGYHYAAFFICITYGHWMKFNCFDNIFNFYSLRIIRLYPGIHAPPGPRTARCELVQKKQSWCGAVRLFENKFGPSAVWSLNSIFRGPTGSGTWIPDWIN